MRAQPTESQQSAAAELDALLTKVPQMDAPSAEAFVLMTGVPLLAKLDAALNTAVDVPLEQERRTA